MPSTYSFRDKVYTTENIREEIKILENTQSLRLVRQEKDHLQLSDGTRTYEVWLVEKGPKTWKLNVDGKEITINKQERLATLFEKIGFVEDARDKISEIKAPMPGTIVEVLVAVDQEVETNDPLIVLEAMKMENIIKASNAGKVSDIMVEQGSVVQKNEVLIKF